ncbi:flagellar biosynthetic protein FliP [Candidatus Phycosocius bacilliformis]|uniref:Flagellar biosynthetic protein FliP n=1 Tax=Candidatus Phycosocius bacilliformis TaxID=1445552 RepID=A0A2P2ECK0_9PROT|nr:flagellar type III secretion system pore protein FliP [Candidatus Phycosocius bacilliformis]GBF58771.1 flagellar biosynthetic protein FliP [Candidatus Phycosocius bacilliformis]
MTSKTAPTHPASRHALKQTLRRWVIIFLSACAASLLGVATAAAQSINLDLGSGTGLTERVVQTVALITILSLAPSVVIMTTSFVRIVVVLSLLRTAIGLQQAPPNAVMVSLALFLTAFIMQPTFERAWNDGIAPMTRQELTMEQAWPRTTEPLKRFMLAQTREKDLELFVRLARIPVPQSPQALPMRVVTPAFMVSELRRAFEIGFLLFVPFLVIDLVVASLLMAMGMMMLPPVVVSLPFKLIFFVLVDGWRLVAESLVQSFRALPPG